LRPAASRVGHIRYTFDGPDHLEPEDGTQHPENEHLRRQRHPYILIDVARPSIITSTPTNITYPPGSFTILPHGENEINGPFEICGYSTERQDAIITPISGQKAAEGFKGYFCARFSSSTAPGAKLGGIRGNRDVVGYGIIQNDTVHVGKTEMEGPLLSAFLFLPDGVDSVDVRVGTSFISVEQARSNLDEEIKDGTYPACCCIRALIAYTSRAYRYISGSHVRARQIQMGSSIRTRQYQSGRRRG
jgi:Glycosyl hydrolase family 92 N-terminal domain